MRLVIERARARGRHGPKSDRARGARPGSTPSHGPARALEPPTSWLTTVPREARKRDLLVIVPRPGEHRQRVTVRVGIGTGDQAALARSAGFPSDPELALAGCAKRRGACSQPCPAPNSLLVL